MNKTKDAGVVKDLLLSVWVDKNRYQLGVFSYTIAGQKVYGVYWHDFKVISNDALKEVCDLETAQQYMFAFRDGWEAREMEFK